VATTPARDVGIAATRAVVVGGSMAGLLAARVLAGHFDEVLLIDRDNLPETADHRKGVPQSRQLHVFLARGLGITERLFPGYGQELRAAGAASIRIPTDMLVLGPSGWLHRQAPGFEFVSASRPLFEATVRRRVRELAGVTVLEGHDVTEPTGSSDGRAVTGVRVRRVGADEGTFGLDADLVVDACGRGSRTPVWLEQLGCPAPAQERVDPDIAYASRIFRIPDGFAGDWKAVMLMSQPPSMPQTGYLFEIEDRQWIVSMMGAGGQHPPTDEDGWTAFTRSLRHPIIADALEQAEPVSLIRGHRGTSNRLWHFERMHRWPEGFLVLGDAVSAFNPIYGQGMSVAAMAAETLDACLQEHRQRHRAGDLKGLARLFQRRLARATAAPWMLSTREDLRFPTTTGMHANAALRAQHRYLDRVVAASTYDPVVAGRYVRVLGMLAPPTTLFRPRVLLAAARARTDGAASAAPPPRPAERSPVPVAAA
jgi:2-polyprenyl-6-methoxyphenol hydroxylase-like FAD-dependent oxidoreductase